MKIRAPKIRLSKKVLFISVGIVALLAGSGAAALYSGAVDSFTKPAEASPIGGECTTIQTMVLKTPAKRLWLRKYIRMEHADGTERIKTALRVAGLLAKGNAVDLIEVSVLDTSGPSVMSDMRGRAIGAEVVIGMQPKYLPTMKEPFIVRYYEGMPNEEGRYYGERVSLDISEIKKMMGAMKNVPDKQDCAEPEKPEPAESANAHGEKKPSETVVTEGHQKPADEGEKAADHGEKQADKNAEGHEAAPGDEANAEGHAPAAKEKSFLDSALGLIGLGGSDEPAEAAPKESETSSHDTKPEEASENHSAVQPEGHDAESKTEDTAAHGPATKHDEHAEEPKASETEQKPDHSAEEKAAPKAKTFEETEAVAEDETDLVVPAKHGETH